MKTEFTPKLRTGDSVAGLYKSTKSDGSECWNLVEDKITKVIQTQKEGWKYYTKSKFRPLYAEDVDSNTKMMEDAVGKGYIITREVFGLNDITKPFAERWMAWANENLDKAVSLLDALEENEERDI